MKKVNINIFFNIVSTMFTAFSPLIVIPIITSSIGLELYGEFVAILSLCAVFVVLCDLGFGMYIPKYMNEKKLYKNVNKDLLIIFVVVKVVLSLLLLTLITAFSNYSVTVLFTISAFVSISNLNPTPIVTGLERYKLLAITSLISKATLVLVALLASYEDFPVEVAMLVQTSMVLVTNLILYTFLLRNLEMSKGQIVGAKEVYQFVKGALGFYFARLTVNVLNQGSTFLVSRFISNEGTAIYSLLVQLYKVGQALLGAISRVLYTNTLKTKCFKSLYFYSVCTVLCILFFSPIIYLFSNDVAAVLLSSTKAEINEFTLIILLSLVFVSISSNYGYPALVAIGKEKYAHLGIFLPSLVYYLAFGLVIFFAEMTMFYALLCILLTDLSSMLIRLFFASKFGVIKCFQNTKNIN
ncbi:hypothetical protein CWB72_05540 [Pseudoalteromonas phenolica]|uniref:oligosaccharide flippase family protein n=1 Tax=Pseudoalteromonas phenolica TaxID=161398 RepID=UPI00110B1286|nr:oligosaccharide flippase family protein [Pseudoalteromonas phenolica]TMN92347.1 hypothetical protein CWB72_05540 [Pseudoalteromonas phenolica]